jgi:XTP/dITP diphosphohydrolase
VARFVLATANPHKVTEMRAVLAPLGVTLFDRPHGVAEVDETEDSLEGNALLKARALAGATGLAAIADDTGLFVDALDGRPGVQSARYAGAGATDDDNVVKLLDELAGVDFDRRGAHFTTVICVAHPDGTWYCVEGVLEGTIAPLPSGDQGFGYDPVFAPSGHGGRTLAEMTPDEKNAVSHRALALRVLALELAQR